MDPEQDYIDAIEAGHRRFTPCERADPGGIPAGERGTVLECPPTGSKSAGCTSVSGNTASRSTGGARSRSGHRAASTAVAPNGSRAPRAPDTPGAGRKGGSRVTRVGYWLIGLPAALDLHGAAGVPGDVAQRVQDGVLAVGADLQGQVAVTLGRLQVVVGEGLHRGQAAGLGLSEGVAVVEQGRADADRDGEAVCRDVRAEAAVVGGRGADAEVGGGAAGGEEAGAAGDRLQQVDQFAAAVGDDIEGDEGGGRGGRGDDAGLVGAVERDLTGVLRLRRGLGGAATVRQCEAAAGQDRSGGSGTEGRLHERTAAGTGRAAALPVRRIRRTA
jgi:hypothetical protein